MVRRRSGNSTNRWLCWRGSGANIRNQRGSTEVPKKKTFCAGKSFRKALGWVRGEKDLLLGNARNKVEQRIQKREKKLT